MNCNNIQFIDNVIKSKPQAFAQMQGNPHSNIQGKVLFYQTNAGVVVMVEVFGLPTSVNQCNRPIFGFHIHQGNSCTGNMQDPFANTMSHYNPQNCKHPNHAGDLPPIFGNNGYGVMMFLTDRFTIDEVIGRTIIIHGSADDFTTQPSGNSGTKIACGIIKRCKAK